MAEEIEKLVVRLGFEVDSDSEAQVAKYRTKLDKLNQTIEQTSKNKVKPISFVPEVFKDALKKHSSLVRDFRNENIEWNKKWDLLSGAEKRGITSFLNRSGLGDIEQSRGEKLRTYLDAKRELLSESKVTIQKEEKFRTKVFSKSQGERDRIVRKFFSTLSIGTRGYLGGILARAGMNAIKQRGKAAQETSTQALLSNMSVQDVQSMQGFAATLGIKPKDLFQAINVYRQKTKAWKVPDTLLLQKLMQQAKAPNAHALAAQMNGISPLIFMKLKEYKGNLKNDLENQKWKLSDDDLKKIERFNGLLAESVRAWEYFKDKGIIAIVDIFNKISLCLERFKKALQSFENPIKTIQNLSFDKIRQVAGDVVSSILKSTKSSIQENVIEPAKKWLEDKAIKNIIAEDPDFEDWIKHSQETSDRSNVVVNNSFNISSSDPKRASEEIQRILNSQYINLFSSPRTVA